jgi:hypothetical protein
LICTPMKISPAATAARPAALVRVVGVMVMSGPLSGWSVAVPPDNRNLGSDGVTWRHHML